MLNLIKTHLMDNSGDENITKMVWVAIAFVVGAILIALVSTQFNTTVRNWYQGIMEKWFNEAEYDFSPAKFTPAA